MNPLRWMFQFALCFHHGHLSRVFTIKKRTYKCAWIVEKNLYCQIPITKSLLQATAPRC